MYTIDISSKANKFLNKLHKNEKQRLIEIISELKNYPNLKSIDMKKIKSKNSMFRIRIGKIRILLYADFDNKSFLIFKIDFRGNVY